jgi:hypothetical protein
MKHIVVLFICLLALLSGNVRSAVVSTPTGEAVATTLATGTVAWSFSVEAGDLAFGHEITLVANGTYIAQHDVWDTPEQMVISYDASGNLLGAVGAVSLVGQPTLPFNTVIIRLSDRSIILPTEFRNGSFDGVSLGSMYADDNNTYADDFEYRMITGFDEEFLLTGDFYRSEFASGSESSIIVTGLYIVPEPSSSMLFLAGIMFLACNRKRPTREGGPFSLTWSNCATSVT